MQSLIGSKPSDKELKGLCLVAEYERHLQKLEQTKKSDLHTFADFSLSSCYLILRAH